MGLHKALGAGGFGSRGRVLRVRHVVASSRACWKGCNLVHTLGTALPSNSLY